MDTLEDYTPVDSGESLEDYTPVNKKPKSYLEIGRELLSPITGPTQRQLEDNPPIVLPENATYLQKLSNAQGLLPKLFTSPVTLPTAPEIPEGGSNLSTLNTLGQIGSGLYNVAAKGVVEPFLSPGGIALGAMSGLGSKSVAPYLTPKVKSGVDLANSRIGLGLGGVLGPQAIGTIIDGLSAPTLQQKIEQVVGGGLLGLGSFAGIRGGLKGKPIESSVKPIESTPSPIESTPTAKQLTPVEPIQAIPEDYPRAKSIYFPEDVANWSEDKFPPGAFTRDLTPKVETLADYKEPEVTKQVEEVKPTETLEDYTPTGEEIKKIEEPLTKDENATQPTSTNIEEHPGVSQGENIPKNIEEVRKIEGEQTSNSGSGERGGEQLSTGEGGLTIKLNPNTSELGGIDMSAVMDFARGVYDNTKDFAKWSLEMVKRFPELGDHIKNIWTRLQAGKLDAPGLTTPVTRLLNQGKEGEDLAQGAIHAYQDLSPNRGKYIEVPTRTLTDLVGPRTPKDFLSNNSESAKRVLQYMDEKYDTGVSNIKLSPKELEAVREVQRLNGEVRNDVNARIVKNPLSPLRGGNINPDYISQGFDRGKLDIITNKGGTPEASKLKQDFIKWRVSRGQTLPEAQGDLDTIIKGFSKQSSTSAESFGPLDKATGKGIPPSWRSQNLFDRIKNYGERVSRRLAYHDNIEMNPLAQAALKIHGASKYWKAIYRELSGQREASELVVNAVTGLAKSGMTGTLTGAVNSINSAYMGFLDHTWKQIATTTLKTGQDFKNNLRRTYEQGNNRKNVASFEFGEGGLTSVIHDINRIRDITNVAQGKNLLERTSRTLTFGAGRINTIENFSALVNGVANKTQKEWFRKFADRENIPQYIKDGVIPEDAIDRIASKYVESVQGGYDLRTLPLWAQEGFAAPIASLSRWSIDRTNRFMHNVVTPLSNGDLVPALKSTLGLIIGATAIDELRKLVTHRRNPVPSISELKAAKEQGADIKGMALYKLASLTSMSSIAGIYGDVIKTIGDAWHGNRVQDINNPAIELSKSVLTGIYNIFKAHADGELSFEDVPGIISEVLESYSQTYRTLLANMSGEKKADIERSNEFKDRRVWRQLQDKTVKDISGDDYTNPLIGKATREFKKTGDINRAVELLPKVNQEVLAKTKGDPEEYLRAMQGVKQNSYQTFPDQTKDPLEFFRYKEYLDKTKGVEEANRMLENYFKQKNINEVKGRFIP